MEKSQKTNNRSRGSLMTSLLGITIPTVTVVVVALSVLLFRIMRSNILDSARVASKDVVECNVRAIGDKYKSFVTQLAGLAEICSRRHYTEKEWAPRSRGQGPLENPAHIACFAGEKENFEKTQLHPHTGLYPSGYRPVFLLPAHL